MLKNLKNKKKKGFTLVELVVVIAIIAILAAVLIPQITGFIKDAKRTDVIEQARKVITVAESVEAKYGGDTFVDSGDGADTATAILSNTASLALMDITADDVADLVDKLSNANLEQCRQIVQTDKYVFDLNDNDTINLDTLDPINPES